MKIEVLRSAAEVAERGASLLEDEVARNPRLVVALPTGRTPIAMYRLLTKRRAQGRFDFKAATTFNLDEVLLPKAMPQTFFRFMVKHVWEPLDVAEERRFIPDGEAADPAAECVRYEAAIAKAGGLDMVFLGIGADGHVAYNLPRQVKPRTHVITLDDATFATLGGDVPGPVRGITMGVETILDAPKLVLLATGGSKAEALRRMRDDLISAEWPCTSFRDHPGLVVLADEAAASQL
ncbi:MAG: glucosamine-6-phosphate deaminase [Vicinamibacteria bacterium]